jgi:hypothetical protein
MAKLIPSIIIGSAITGVSSAQAYVNINIESNESVPAELKEALDNTFEQKNTVETIGKNLKPLAEVLKNSVPEINRLNELNDGLLNLAYNQDSTTYQRHISREGAACYQNCYTNCHKACHGSRGWR